MSSFAEFIAESFYSTVNLSWNVSGPSRVVARFSADPVTVEVVFERRENSAVWSVSFNVEKDEKYEAVHLAFHIFNGVFQAVREFLEVRQPDLLVFATKRDALANIYQTYLRREQARLKELGYQLEGPQLTLRRIVPPEWQNN